MHHTNESIQEIMSGFRLANDEYHCLYCEQTFKVGLVYPHGEQLELAEYAMKRHIQEVHGGTLKPLLALNKQESGISESQRQILALMSIGLTDKEIAERLNISTSGVRNHRFKLREKQKQAKILLAVMSLVDKETLIPLEYTSFQEVDDRFKITEKDRADTLANFLTEDGRAKHLPSKEKKKIILLQELVRRFSPDQNYSEKEVNTIIQTMFDDYVTVRRYLIGYGMMGRTNDGSAYWVI